MQDLKANLLRVRAAISQAATRSGRSDASVTLIAASKMVDGTTLRCVTDLGQRVFGENRVQEGKQKWPDIRAEVPEIEVHLIGPLQINKVRDAVAYFDVIQSVDRIDLARAIARECAKQARRIPIYIQVNTSGETQKSGIRPEDALAFVDVCRAELHLNVCGLMCVPAAAHDPSEEFDLLRQLARRSELISLSMGMSGDFACAIEHEATHVRIGSAIFGARTPVAT